MELNASLWYLFSFFNHIKIAAVLSIPSRLQFESKFLCRNISLLYWKRKYVNKNTNSERIPLQYVKAMETGLDYLEEH